MRKNEEAIQTAKLLYKMTNWPGAYPWLNSAPNSSDAYTHTFHFPNGGVNLGPNDTLSVTWTVTWDGGEASGTFPKPEDRPVIPAYTPVPMPDIDWRVDD